MSAQNCTEGKISGFPVGPSGLYLCRLFVSAEPARRSTYAVPSSRTFVCYPHGNLQIGAYRRRFDPRLVLPARVLCDSGTSERVIRRPVAARTRADAGSSTASSRAGGTSSRASTKSTSSGLAASARAIASVRVGSRAGSPANQSGRLLPMCRNAASAWSRSIAPAFFPSR